MSEEMEQCENCLQMFPESKIPTHFGYCRRNIKKCNKCGEMYDINFQEEHQEEFHKTVPCPHCKTSFHPNDLKNHQSNCHKKPMFCQYCELQVPVQQFPSHLKACESRTKQCEKCMKAISNKEFLIHLTTCKGIVQQPKPSKNYNEYLKEQRNQIKKEEPKKEYANYNEKPKVVERREYQYRPREQPKRQEIKREAKYEYKYEPKPIERKEIKVADKKQTTFKYGTREISNGYQKPITSSHNIGTKVEVKPVRKQIFTKQVPSYTREQPRMQSREQPKVYYREQPKVVPKEYKQEYKADYKPAKEISNPIQKPIEHYSKPTVVRENQPHVDNYNLGGNGIIDEDEELQRAIMESMGQKFEKKAPEIPQQLVGDDMNQSFYNDFDIEKQIALMKDIEQKKRR